MVKALKLERLAVVEGIESLILPLRMMHTIEIRIGNWKEIALLISSVIHEVVTLLSNRKLLQEK